MKKIESSLLILALVTWISVSMFDLVEDVINIMKTNNDPILITNTILEYSFIAFSPLVLILYLKHRHKNKLKLQAIKR